ncbi:MAG: hypothetical protein ICV83_26095 [Cytophagales bacterium]|nr:hypothetical protein [Cytophagales bacterium]
MRTHSFLQRLPWRVVLLLGVVQTAAAQGRFTLFPQGDKPGPLLYATLVLLALLTALAVHELGHLVAGLLGGFRFELFVVGLLGVKRTPAGIRVFLNRDVGLMGGVAATVPATQDPGNQRKFAWVLLSGPLASLLLSLLAAGLFAASTSGAARSYWLVTAFGSAAVLLATTLPRKSGLFFTDRARFQRLMGKGPAAETEAALLSIIARQVMDGGVKNIALDQARLLQTDPDATMRFWGSYFAYAYFRENGLAGEAERARTDLAAFEKVVPKPLWKSLKLDEGTVVPPEPGLQARE